jgi:catechol 2,3-dioxygenase-like lactoylglutathione lyase family enzyme
LVLFLIYVNPNDSDLGRAASAIIPLVFGPIIGMTLAVIVMYVFPPQDKMILDWSFNVMSDNAFRVQQIDHVELFVPDQYEAAAWYEKVFGLHIMREFEFWAKTGPLMMSSADAGTKLAIFQGDPPYDRALVGLHRVAFRVDGAGYMAFLDGIEALELTNHRGEVLTRGQVVDHDLAWSIYFNDPYGHRFEITCYDYEYVKERL